MAIALLPIGWDNSERLLALPGSTEDFDEMLAQLERVKLDRDPPYQWAHEEELVAVAADEVPRREWAHVPSLAWRIAVAEHLQHLARQEGLRLLIGEKPSLERRAGGHTLRAAAIYGNPLREYWVWNWDGEGPGYRVLGTMELDDFLEWRKALEV